MNKIVVAMMAAISLTSCGTVKHESGGHVVLPNYTLLACRSASCPEVWQDKLAATNALYPKQVIIDIDNTSGRGVVGVMATYDKSVSINDIKLSIDQRYGKWAFSTNGNSPVKLWRVEPEKFAIALAPEDDGTKHVIYLAFATNAQVFEDWTNSGAFGGLAHEQVGATAGSNGRTIRAPHAK